MKRARTSSKSAETVAGGAKDEPPKKIARKRVKSVAQSPLPRPDSQTSPVQAASVKSNVRSATKLGSLPMYGEYLPDGGAVAIPKLAEKTCGNVRDIMEQLKELKTKGGKVSLLCIVSTTWHKFCSTLELLLACYGVHTV